MTFSTTGLIEIGMQGRKGSDGLRGSYYTDSDGNIVAKTCSTCREVKEKTEYNKRVRNKYELNEDCRTCVKNANRIYRVKSNSTPGMIGTIERNRRSLAQRSARTDQEILADQGRFRPTGDKPCRTCREILPLAEFRRDVTRTDGLNVMCRTCHVAKVTNQQTASYTRYWEEHGIPVECYACGGQYQEDEHVVPIKLNGPDIMENILPSCRECNRGEDGKHYMPLTTWLRDNRPDSYTEVLTRVLSYGVWPFYTPVDGVSPGGDYSHLLTLRDEI